MPKQPTSPRASRPAPEPDDKFIAAVASGALWMRAHSRALIAAGIVLVLAVGIGIYYIQSQRRVEAEAAMRLTQVQQSVVTGNVPLAIRDLQEYLASFGGTRAAREARILLADLLLTQERPQDALQTLGRLPRDLEDPTGLAAAQLQAAAYEALGNYDQALSTYRTIARNARFEFQRREALAAAARVALQSARPQEAADFYDQLVQTFPEADPTRTYFEMWRAEARARATRAPTTAATPDPAAPAEAQLQPQQPGPDTPATAD
jgi:tetratricopeptide (TPR) repeat protein